MNPSIARLTLRLPAVVFVAMLIQACNREHLLRIDSAPSEPASPPPAQATIADLVEGPLTMFDRACARCHGPQGSLFGSDFAKLSDDELHRHVEEMMKGPAQLQPTALQIDAMVAYQRALRDHHPFLCVTNAAAFTSRKETVLHGEVTPGASVALSKGSTTVKANVDAQIWSIIAPPRPPFVLRAEAKSFSSELDFPARLWSR